MQKDSAQAKISLKVVGGLLFLTHPVDTYWQPAHCGHHVKTSPGIMMCPWPRHVLSATADNNCLLLTFDENSIIDY